ncbi:MAG: HAMP domain-containing histidine kinase [Bacteroidales bacterium]|nr:HAMP domain-containing histidine kinase [Bacteroidales bacterium]
MDENTKKRRTLGWLMFAMAVIILLTTGIASICLKRPEVGAKIVQYSVRKVEKNIQELVENNANYHQYDLAGAGLYIFHNDSLLYWNNNLVGPKLIRRKVQTNNDTICNLLTGDYYVRTFSKGNLNYYVFKLINTTYRLENTFFENRFLPLQGFIDSKVHFTNDAGFEILTNSGKHLANCQIERITLGRFLWFIIGGMAFIMFVIAIVLLIPRNRTTSNKAQKFKVEYGIAAILLIAIVATYLFYDHNRKEENEEMASMAEHLVQKRDLAFENAFQQFADDIKTDSSFHEILFGESNILAEVVLGYSKELLFNETMKGYQATLTICSPEDYIDIQPEDTIENCDDYFLEKLAKNSQKRVGEGLYSMDYNTLDPNYLAKIKVHSDDTTQQRTLYFEFYNPIAPEGFGFPQLLQEKNSEKPYDYSVASYRDNVLTYKYGKYIYPNFLKEISAKNHEFTYENGYKHYSINNEDNNVLIISTSRKGWSEISGPFALFFLGLLLPYLFVYWLLKPKKQKPWKDRNFRQRLQTVIFITLGVAFLAIGPVSIVYMRSLYNQKTMTAQFETTRTLALEMQNNIDFEHLIGNASRDNWLEIMQHYANTFFTDLNLYSLDGKLIAATRPEIYELTLQAPIMNAEAYQNMFRNKALYYTHKEQLGKGIYESAYLPIADAQGNTLAYLNTPYFSSETDLHKEIKAFMLTYTNIILVLLGVALVFVIGITKRLTQPLSLIQNKLGDIKIDQKNEPIEWKRDDEIGALVKQYNLLIIELEKSAAELKRTTAESAWRDVARQVAHEIKNSLTPMRLSVQLLQRNIENGKATPEQTQRTANTLIEQIDALSDIASSFSRYAKLPENHPQPLDLIELIDNVVNLYDNKENITFSYLYDQTKDHTYNGDKTNLNSAIGNLIKNATQAIGSKMDGKIEVWLESTETTFVITVKDNGKGIKEEDKSRIFLPNFTTKTTGSGVGLSLTYNIVQSAGGTISFESEEGRGAEFVITLPKS